MNMAYPILILVVAQRLFELVLAERNTRALLAAGGREESPEHYKWIVLLHTAWLAALFVAASIHVRISVPWLLVFAGLQILRVWVQWTLGPYWTTRIIRPANNCLVRTGPYRFLRHPNYLVVAGEILALPMALGWPRLALVFSVLNLAVLAVRIRAENLALGFGAQKRRPAA